MKSIRQNFWLPTWAVKTTHNKKRSMRISHWEYGGEITLESNVLIILYALRTEQITVSSSIREEFSKKTPNFRVYRDSLLERNIKSKTSRFEFFYSKARLAINDISLATSNLPEWYSNNIHAEFRPITFLWLFKRPMGATRHSMSELLKLQANFDSCKNLQQKTAPSQKKRWTGTTVR